MPKIPQRLSICKQDVEGRCFHPAPTGTSVQNPYNNRVRVTSCQLVCPILPIRSTKFLNFRELILEIQNTITFASKVLAISNPINVGETMFVRFAIVLAICAYILPFEKAYGGVVTLGDRGTTSVTNAITTSLWIRFTTVANGAAAYNLTSIYLRGTATDTGVTYNLYNSSGGAIINSISGARTMTNGLLNLTGENSFAGGSTSATYVLEIAGLAASTYLRSNAGTSTQSGAALYLPSSDTGIITHAYEQLGLTDSTRVGGGSSYAVTLSISAVPEPSTFFLMGSVLLTAIVFTCANSFRKCQKKRMG